MYIFCAICSGVLIRFLNSDYQERPLKMLDWSSGTIFPFNVRLLLKLNFNHLLALITSKSYLTVIFR